MNWWQAWHFVQIVGMAIIAFMAASQIHTWIWDRFTPYDVHKATLEKQSDAIMQGLMKLGIFVGLADIISAIIGK